jgi:hypothetical protein
MEIPEHTGPFTPSAPSFQAAAFFVPIRLPEDSVYYCTDVREGTRLGHGGVGAIIRRLPQSGGIRGRGEKGV